MARRKWIMLPGGRIKRRKASACPTILGWRTTALVPQPAQPEGAPPSPPRAGAR